MSNMCGESDMKKTGIFFLVLVLFACFDESSVVRSSETYTEDPDFGWRKDDFVPVLDDSKTFGGLKSIYHVGELCRNPA